jgi:hypothetical protein
MVDHQVARAENARARTGAPGSSVGIILASMRCAVAVQRQRKRRCERSLNRLQGRYSAVLRPSAEPFIGCVNGARADLGETRQRPRIRRQYRQELLKVELCAIVTA